MAIGMLCSNCGSDNTETKVLDNWEKTLMALATECKDCGYAESSHGTYNYELYSALQDQL